MDAAGNEKRRFALYEGATQVYADRLTVLARFGVDVDNIDAEAVRKKADGMRERVAELEAKHADDPEVESYGAILETSRARLAWYETQLRVAEGAPAK